MTDAAFAGPLAIGKAFGTRYHIIRLLGVGGMGAVYQASDAELGVAVALKVIRPEVMANESAAADVERRFKRELLLARQVTHKNVVRIHDIGDMDGIKYLTMPFIEGETLAAMIRRVGVLSTPHTIAIAKQITAGLVAAHDAGVMHRDLKPENIMISADGTALIMDFGLSRSFSGTGATTGIGGIVGTLEYMAPEQAESQAVDHRADIYSLGLIIYDMLSGRRRLAASESPMPELMSRLRHAVPPLHTLNPEVPPDLERIVMRCVLTSPDARYQSTTEVADDLERLNSTGWAVPAATRARRRAAMLVGASVAIVGIAILATLWVRRSGASGGFAPSTTTHAQVLVTDLGVTASDTSARRVVADALRTGLAQSSTISVVPVTAVKQALERMRRPADTPLDFKLATEIARREGIESIVDGTVTPLGSGLVITLRLVVANTGEQLAALTDRAERPTDLLAAIDRLSRQLRRNAGESLRGVNATPPLERVTTTSLEALRKYFQGTRAIALEGDYKRAVALLEDAVAIDTMFAMAYRRLVIAYQFVDYPQRKIDSAAIRAFRFRERLPDQERYLTEGTYYTYGPARNRERAIQAYEALLEIAPRDAAGLANLALIYRSRREFDRAAAFFRRAMDAPATSVAAYHGYALSLFNAGKIAAARAAQDTLVARYPQAAGLFGRGADVSFAFQAGRLDSAERVCREMREQPRTADREWATECLQTLAMAHGRLHERDRLAPAAEPVEKRDAAMEIAAAADSAWVDTYIREQPRHATERLDRMLKRLPLRQLPLDSRPYLWLADVYAHSGRPDQARAFVREFDALQQDASYRAVRRAARHGVLAQIALAEHRFDDAIRETIASDNLSDGPERECNICFFAEMGRAFDAASRLDSAAFYYERYFSTPFWFRASIDAIYAPALHARLGAIYEARKDSARALSHYRKFIDLWNRADDDLQPKVRQIQLRVQALEGRD